MQILFKTEDPFSIDDISDLAFRVEEVSEFSCPCGAGLHAGRVSPLPYPLDAERALFDDALYSGTVSEVMDIGVDLILRKIWFRPVEDPSFIRAGG